MNAGQVPIHSKPEDKGRCPDIFAMLIPKKGTKIRKPQAALNPTPIIKLINNSIDPS